MSIESLRKWEIDNPGKRKAREPETRAKESKKRRDKLKTQLADAQREYFRNSAHAQRITKEYQSKNQNETKNNANNSRQLWTKSATDLVMSELYTYRELADMLGRSFFAIKARKSVILRAERLLSKDQH